MRTNYFLKYVAGILLVGFAIAISSCNKQEKISIAGHVWPGYEYLHLANTMGWLVESATIVETSSATETLELIKNNQVDAGMLTLDEVLRLVSEGVGLEVVLIFDISTGADMVVARENINLSNLKGKRIGVESTAVGGILLEKLLEKASVKPSEVEIVNTTIDEHSDNWSANKVDVVVTYEPNASEMLKQKGNIIFDSSETPDLIFDVLAVRSDALTGGKEDALKKVINMNFRARKYVVDNKHDAVFRIGEHMKIPTDEVFMAFRGLEYPNFESNKAYLSGYDGRLDRAVTALNSLMLANGMINSNANYDNLFNSEYLVYADSM